MHSIDIDTHIMKFIIKTTGIADGLSVLVSSPQSGGGCFTVSTAGPFPPGRGLKSRSDGGGEKQDKR